MSVFNPLRLQSCFTDGILKKEHRKVDNDLNVLKMDDCSACHVNMSFNLSVKSCFSTVQSGLMSQDQIKAQKYKSGGSQKF